MISEIITKSGKRYNTNDGKTISIKWSYRFGCFLINNVIKIYIENVKSLTCKEDLY